jgi:hypothetical protein
MPKQKATRKKRLTQAGHYRGMKHAYDHLHSQYGGFHSKVVVQAVARSMIAERKSQFLTHLATALKAWYKNVSDGSEIEIQIALFNDSRVLIASNKNETAEYLYDQVVKSSAGKFLEYLKNAATIATKAALKSKASDSARVERHSAKAIKEIVGTRTVGLPHLSELQEEGKKICVKFDASDDIGTSFASFLNGGMADKHVAILSSDTPMHAEQKMLLALCKASSALTRSEPIIVAGTFRPCRGCFESLSVVQRYGFQKLQFGVRPGHYWDTTTRAHVEIVGLLRTKGLISESQWQSDFDKDGLLIGLTNTSHRPVLRVRGGGDEDDLHYASESDSDDDDSDDDSA